MSLIMTEQIPVDLSVLPSLTHSLFVCGQEERKAHRSSGFVLQRGVRMMQPNVEASVPSCHYCNKRNGGVSLLREASNHRLDYSTFSKSHVFTQRPKNHGEHRVDSLFFHL